ncbi:putative type VI secretion system effector, partial [Rahnella victoriana]
TSCLRSEFKDPDRLEGCFASLNIYIASRTESINEYDETYHSSNATESSEERQNREYIDTLRERVIRAKEYLRQVEAETIKRDNEGASLLLLLQFFAGDAPHARFNDGKRKVSKCSYIKGKVNGKIFSGWVRQTNVQVRDYVEMAAMSEENNYYIYALATPNKGIISTIPNCYAGRMLSKH